MPSVEHVPLSGAVASALIYVVVVLAVAAVVYLLASLVFGRGEELEPLRPGATPTRLPPSPLAGHDVRSLRFQLVFRGYKVSEVDWALERLADELDDARRRVTLLERELKVERQRRDDSAEANGQDSADGEGTSTERER